MRTAIYTIVAAAAAVSAQTATTFADAPVITNEVKGAGFVATFPNKAGLPQGSVQGVSAADGKGVTFSVSVSNLPSTGGPFLYHIHEYPVPTDGNCTGTGGHLDPLNRGEKPACDPSKKATCQVGDLAGKYGTLTGPASSAQYTDLYTSTNPSDPSFIGNLSVVIHFANTTRLTCANFTMLAGSSPVSSGYAMPTGAGGVNSTMPAGPTGTGTGGASSAPGSSGTGSGSVSTATPTQPPHPGSTGAAAKLMVGGAGLLAGVVAFVL